MKEIWKDIPGYNGMYQVSDLGRVKSFWFNKIRILKAGKNKSGYYTVVLCKNKKQTSSDVHVLIAKSFLEHVPNGHEIVVDHIDNNKSNNKLSNLQLITHRLNTSKDRKGLAGASFVKSRNKWISVIQIKGKLKNLGRFNTELEAHKEYKRILKQIS